LLKPLSDRKHLSPSLSSSAFQSPLSRSSSSLPPIAYSNPPSPSTVDNESRRDGGEGAG
jgi:hypothetical protein